METNNKDKACPRHEELRAIQAINRLDRIERGHYIYTSAKLDAIQRRSFKKATIKKMLMETVSMEQMAEYLTEYIYRERTQGKKKITLTMEEFIEHFHIRRPRVQDSIFEEIENIDEE